MALVNYSDLQTEIESWHDDASITSYVPDIITVAESNIKDKVRIREMVTRATASTNTTRRLELPDGFVEMITLHVDGSPLKALDFMTPEQVNTHYNSSSGKPSFFTIVGTELWFDKIPDSTYTVEMKFYKFSALSDSNTTNVILTKYPDLYLNECLVSASRFTHESDKAFAASLALHGDPRVPKDKGIYGRINKAEKRARFSNQSLVSRYRGAVI